MSYPIDYKDINPGTEYFIELKLLYEESENYLKAFKWCDEILSARIYVNLGRVFSIFLFKIKNNQSVEDNFIWVIAGDLPFMYLDIKGAKSTKDVVERYIDLASEWIQHVKDGEHISNCYPFDANPTIELAELLEKRILFMKNTLLETIEDIKSLT